MRPPEGLRLGLELLRLVHEPRRSTEARGASRLRSLRRQLAHAATHVPHYRRTWAEAGCDPQAIRGIRDLTALPIVRREDVQAHPQAFLSEAGDRRRWHRSRTSGSTGRPLESHFDPDCWVQVKIALKLRRLLAAGWRPGRRLVVVETVPPQALASHHAALRLPVEGLLGGRTYLSAFEPPETHLQAYRRLRPHFLYAPPSYLSMLAESWDADLRAHVPLQALMTSAEWAPPSTRARLAECFGAPVLDVYGSTEFKEIAWQCAEADAYHVNSESVLIEIVDEAGKPVPDGEAGELLVTSLTNRAMPLIRYATGDRARLRTLRCPCGRSGELLAGIEGRVADYLHLPDGRTLSPYELTTAMESEARVRHYEVEQRSRSRVHVRVVLAQPSESADDPVDPLKSLHDTLSGVLGDRVALSLERVDAIPRAPSGKQRLIRAARSPAEPS